jgi:hypothetical protein|tara:strand:+ start:88 stop:441 length:354 start_codon:yes stop_codon:yes gene_type:complete
METKQIFILVFLVLSIFSLSRIRVLDEYVMPGNELEIHTSMVNNGDKDIDDVRVVAVFHDLGEDVRANGFDVQDNDNHGKFLWWDVPYTIPKGEYLVRITASNDDYRARKFRFITVE